MSERDNKERQRRDGEEERDQSEEKRKEAIGRDKGNKETNRTETFYLKHTRTHTN